VGRRLLAALSAPLVAVGLAVGLTAAGAGGAGADPGSLLGRLLPLGCANPATHGAAHLLPAVAGSARGRFTCFGQARVAPDATAGPSGYGPAQLRSAYALSGLHGSGRIVAVVDAYDDPNAEADLAVYRQTYGLPACTTANRCFRKVNQFGSASSLPQPDYGWAEEISLDLDAVSATCPDCRILLVEADSPETGPLMTAVDTAVRLGATAVSMSWGGTEDRTILAADRHLYHPGVNLVAASGDEGYGAQWPASSPYVTAVGGTTLRRSTNSRGWSETVWSGTGSGCSRYEPKPAWQRDRGCARRTVADVAAVADPATGLAVYDTFNDCLVASLCDGLIASGLAQGLNGWARVGGTSLSAPIVASIYALTPYRRGVKSAYGYPQYLNDVRSGSNGSCGGSYLCTAKVGYDGPTGMGTPRGGNDF
jgi:hypothetical protein